MIRQLISQTSMKTAVAAFLLIAAALWGNTEAFSDAAMDCCLSISTVRVPHQIAASYIVQTTNTGCSIAATVFITKKNRKLCSPPQEDTAYPWVGKLISHLDKLAAKKAHKRP